MPQKPNAHRQFLSSNRLSLAVIQELKTKLIRLADKYYKIPRGSLVDGEEPEYDPNVRGEGEARYVNGRVRVRIGEKAFISPGWLASTKIHEIVGHGGQAVAERWYAGEKGRIINEIEAYDIEINNAKRTGLAQYQIEELERRRQELYFKLDEDNQKKIEKKDYTLAFAAPTERSVGDLAGRTQLFVAGSVLPDETMAVTVRGPNSFEGLVVSAEVDGKKVEARSDRQGRALVDFAPLAEGLLAETTAVIRVLDARGNVVSSGQTRIVPGESRSLARPQVPSLPRLLRNGDVVTLSGQNLGAEAQLILGNRVQETLAASSHELTAFVDAPSTGPQSALVQTPYGVSQSQTVHCYNFRVQLSQNTILRGQRVLAVASYEGLPPGAEVVFTNATPEVVTMRVLGEAQNLGEKSVVRILHPSGNIQVELVGRTKGSFVIQYAIVPSQGLEAPPPR